MSTKPNSGSLDEVHEEKREYNSSPLRLVIPQFLLKKLSHHPLTKSLYPLAIGHHAATTPAVVKQQQNKHYLLLYCYGNEGKLTVNEITQNIVAGDLVMIPPGLNCSYQCACVYWVTFTGDLSRDFYQRLFMKMTSYKAFVGHLPKVIQDFEQLMQLSGKGYTATNVIYAVHVLQHCLSYLALQLRLNPQMDNQLNLAAIENFMTENLNREITLDELAGYCKLSKYHFSKKFKALTDNSPVQHVIHLKMEKACQLLDQSNMTVKEVAAEVGYNDPYYFSRIFKKILGLSPLQYRQDKA